MQMQSVAFGLVLALTLTPGTSVTVAPDTSMPGTVTGTIGAWAVKDSTGKWVLVPAPSPKSTARNDSTRPLPFPTRGWVRSERGLPVSLTPGPMLAPGSPIANRITIVPFPVPGETSLTARELSKQLNRPREGVTALEPPSAGAVDGRMFSRLPPGSYQVLPQPDTLRVTWRSRLYPKAARDAGIQGTVLVMAEIMPDGSVGKTRVVESISALDDAAVQTVKLMRFRPARDQDQPVSVWLGIPVKFTLH